MQRYALKPDPDELIKEIGARNERLVTPLISSEVQEDEEMSPQAVISQILHELGKIWHEEANWWEDSGRRGRVETARTLRAAAGYAVSIAQSMNTDAPALAPNPSLDGVPYAMVKPAYCGAKNLITGQLCMEAPHAGGMHEGNGIRWAVTDAEIARGHGAVSTTIRDDLHTGGPSEFMTQEQSAEHLAAHPGAPGSPTLALPELPSHDAERIEPSERALIDTLADDSTILSETVASIDAEAMLRKMSDWTVATDDGYMAPAIAPIEEYAFLDPKPFRADPATLGPVAPYLLDVSGIDTDFHVSHSQIETLGNCMLKYRLKYLDKVPTGAPAWWNVGGTTFHECVREIEQNKLFHPHVSGPDENNMVANLWDRHWLTTSFSAVMTNPNHPPETWRAAKGGTEGQHWWNEQGPEMLHRYLRGRADSAREGNVIASEAQFELDVDGVPLIGFIDQVKETPGRWVIIDLKTGPRKPADTLQLGIYAHAWRKLGSLGAPAATAPGDSKEPLPLAAPVSGRYYMARQGEYGESHDVLVRHPWQEIVHRTHEVVRARKAGVFPAHVSSFCASCEVKRACPIMATRR